MSVKIKQKKAVDILNIKGFLYETKIKRKNLWRQTYLA